MKTLILVILLTCSQVYSQWQQVYGSPYIYCLGAHGTNIFTGTGYGLFVSSNSGANWTQTSLSSNALSLTASGSILIAGTSNGIYRSTNNGVNWLATNITGSVVRCFTVSGNNVFAGHTNGVYISNNNGANWTQTSLVYEVYALAAGGNNIYAGTYSMGVFVSSNSGANWTQTSLNNRYMRSLAVSGNYIYAGTYAYGVYISSNNGANWTQSLPGKNIYSLAAYENSVFAGSDSGIHVSNDNGMSWTQKNEGLGSYLSIGSQCVFNGYLFTAKEPLNGTGIFRRSLTELVGIEQLSSEVPNSFLLSQNYPNPFNPVTNIEFAIPIAAFVKLMVYDISGREMETLLNQNMTAGTYKADWDASGYSSGVYFYRFEAAGYSDVKKMMLVK